MESVVMQFRCKSMEAKTIKWVCLGTWKLVVQVKTIL